MIRKYPNIATAKLESIWDDDRNFKASPDAESLNEVEKRIERRLKELHSRYPGKNILLVTHAGVLVSQDLGWKDVASMSMKRDRVTNRINIAKINSGK
jgi:broad specificity phosphatase PhoE